MFKKPNRLAKTKDVQTTLASGRGFFNQFWTIKFKTGQMAESRFTVIISTKVAKQAVIRNRIKRILRDFLRHNIAILKKGDYAIIIKSRIKTLTAKEIRLEMQSFLTKTKFIKN
jgi:ribonuclease P protein component